MIKTYDELILDIGIDGLPLFKGSSKFLWPILGKIVNISRIRYLGDKKPRNVDNYLHDFVEEIKKIKKGGTIYKISSYQLE